MSPRDRQRAKVYDAEHLVRRLFENADESGSRAIEIVGSTMTLPIERKFASVESVQSDVAAGLGLNWVCERWPRATAPMLVRERAGSTAAHYEVASATLAIPLHRGARGWALRELVVLHEIAHHLGEPAEEPHGGAFAARFIELVTEIIGPEAGLVLRVTLTDCGAQIG